MIVYFEDGPLTFENLAEDTELIWWVRAEWGYSNCHKELKYISENLPFNTKVYTNSLDAFSNFWCWNNEKKMPMIYIRDKNGEWKLISELTNRQLCEGHNLEKLYVNGEFCDVAQ